MNLISVHKYMEFNMEPIFIGLASELEKDLPEIPLEELLKAEEEKEKKNKEEEEIKHVDT